MVMDTNWPRWIFASIGKHFESQVSGIPMMMEGEHRDDQSAKDSMEIRMDGPSINEINKNIWKITLDINVLINSAMDDINFFRLHVNVGKVSAAFITIQVLKYGDGEALLGCLELRQSSGNREILKVNHFGQVAPDIKLLKATVEGHYEMFLKT